MAKINRKTGNYLPFGINSSANKRTVFGSLSTSPVFSDSLDDNINANFLKGWEDFANISPLQYFNAIHFTLAQSIAYLMQMGIGEWSSGQEYYTNSRVIGSDGKIYKCLIDTSTVDPVGDLTGTWEVDNTNEFVSLTGNQNIDGVKTFLQLPLLPTGTPTGQQAVSANYFNAISLPLINWLNAKPVDKLSERFFDIVYTNNNNYPLRVCITFGRNDNVSLGPFDLATIVYIDGIKLLDSDQESPQGEGRKIPIEFTVPPASKYEVINAANVPELNELKFWFEYLV